MKVENMTSSRGNKVANQLIVDSITEADFQTKLPKGISITLNGKG